jgi:hypothetical protein
MYGPENHANPLDSLNSQLHAPKGVGVGLIDFSPWGKFLFVYVIHVNCNKKYIFSIFLS